MISELKKNKIGLSWILKGKRLKVKCKEIDNYLFVEKSNLVLVLTEIRNNFPSRLVGYTISGELLFSVKPPQGFLFSYLIEHPEANVALVCSANTKIEGWYDWHFSIHPETGEMQRWCPAM